MLFSLVNIFPIIIVFKILFPIFQSILKLHSYVVIVVLNLKGIMPNLFGKLIFISLLVICLLPVTSYYWLSLMDQEMAARCSMKSMGFGGRWNSLSTWLLVLEILLFLLWELRRQITNTEITCIYAHTAFTS